MSPETVTPFLPVSFPSLVSENAHQTGDHSRASGHAAGFAAGLRAAGAELAGQKAVLDAEHRAIIRHESARTDRAIAVLAAAAAALDARLLPVLSEVENVLAASAIDLAETIVGAELADGPASARNAVARVLAAVDSATIHSIRLNPIDLDALDDTVRDAAGVTFVEDPTLLRGDAIADLPIGYLDARVTTALARAREAILGGGS